jgi:hypothetical protein
MFISLRYCVINETYTRLHVTIMRSILHHPDWVAVIIMPYLENQFSVMGRIERDSVCLVNVLLLEQRSLLGYKDPVCTS